MVCGVDPSSWVHVSMLRLQLWTCERAVAAGERHGPRLNIPSLASGDRNGVRQARREVTRQGERWHVMFLSAISFLGGCGIRSREGTGGGGRHHLVPSQSRGHLWIRPRVMLHSSNSWIGTVSSVFCYQRGWESRKCGVEAVW